MLFKGIHQGAKPILVIDGANGDQVAFDPEFLIGKGQGKIDLGAGQAGAFEGRFADQKGGGAGGEWKWHAATIAFRG